MESDIREFVKRRKISGGTRNDAGRRCRDTFASLKKTCRKLGVRSGTICKIGFAGSGLIPRLAELIRKKAQPPPPQRPSRARLLKDRRARFQIEREAIEESL